MARRRKFNHAAKHGGKRSQVEASEIEQLEQTLESGKPAPNTDVPALPANSKSGSYAGVKLFAELPISQYTKDGLSQSNFSELTAIQRAALPHALCGRDILGAAKTGSGKTLAFLIPVSPVSIACESASCSYFSTPRCPCVAVFRCSGLIQILSFGDAASLMCLRTDWRCNTVHRAA